MNLQVAILHFVLSLRHEFDLKQKGKLSLRILNMQIFKT